MLQRNAAAGQVSRASAAQRSIFIGAGNGGSAAPAAGAALLAPMLESARGSNNRIEATLSVPAGNENGSGAWFKPRH
jgi:hypothetical protein